MDEKKQERIHAIARSLKELHLAATMEEAVARAKEILDSADAEHLKKAASKVEREAANVQKEHDSEKKEIVENAAKERAQVEMDVKGAHKDMQKIKHAKETLAKDIKTHSLEKGDVKSALRNVDEISCAADDAEYIIEEAEEVQKEKN